MVFDVSKLTTVGQLKTLAERTKTEIANAIAAIPQEIFLDQAKTQFIPSFAFNATTYPGATNPNLDGKPVMVLAVKGIDHNNNDAETLTYSFLDMAALVDTYTAKAGDSAKILNIAGYEIEVKIDSNALNHISVTNDGLMVDVSDKADKVSNATNNNLSGLDANGNLIDSGIAKDNVIQVSNVALDAEVAEMINGVFGA